MADLSNLEEVQQIEEPSANGQQISTPQAPTVIIQQGPARAAPKQRTVRQMESTQAERLFASQPDDKVAVYFLKPDGPPDGIYRGTYSAGDLQNCVTVEQFLDKYVRPRFTDGYGEYVVKLINAQGKIKKIGRFGLDRPIDHSGNGNSKDPVVGLLRDVIEARERTGNGVQPYQVDELKQLLMKQSGVVHDPTTTAILGKLDDISKGLQPREESMERMLLAKLLKRVEEMDKPAPMPMMPPMPSAPAVDPVMVARETVREMVRELADTLRPPPAPPQMSFSEMVSMFERMQPKKEEKDSFVDQLGKFAQVWRDLKGDEDNKDPMEWLSQVTNAVDAIENIGKRRMQPQSDNFGGWVRDIFTGLPTTIKEAGNLVDKVRDKEVAATKRMAMQAAMRQRRAQPAPVQEEPQKEEPQQSPYPEGFEPYLKAVAIAANDLDRIKSTLAAFQYLGQLEPWKPYWQQAVALTRSRDRQALQYIVALTDNFTKTGVLPQAQREAIVKSFETHFGTICDKLFPN